MRSLFERLPEIKACPDCRIVPVKLSGGQEINDVRICAPCKARFKAEPEIDCEHEFDPDEGFMCLYCGKEGLEEAMSDAYDRAKDLRKYGDD